MRALITGSGGFVGGYLCNYLLAQTDWELLGTVYPGPVADSQPSPRLRQVYADLKDVSEVAHLVASFQPDVIFHLAAQSLPSASFRDPWGTLENNIRGQLNLLQAVQTSCRSARMLVIGSAEEYGPHQPEELPLTEESPLRPSSPYAISKVAQDFMGLQYHLAFGTEVVRVRPFNHTGPGRPPHFVVPAFARQISLIEAGLQEPVMKVGNLETSRDFTDVRDIVRAYYLAVTQGEPGEVYNLASGQPRLVRGILEQLLGFSKVEIQVEIDPDLYRPADVAVVYGSSEKFHQQTGWKPEILFEQTLEDVLAYWRERVAD